MNLMKSRSIYVRAISFSHFEITSVLRLRGATCCKQDLVTAQTPIFVTINTLLLRPHPGRLDNQKMYDKPHFWSHFWSHSWTTPSPLFAQLKITSNSYYPNELKLMKPLQPPYVLYVCESSPLVFMSTSLIN